MGTTSVPNPNRARSLNPDDSRRRYSLQSVLGAGTDSTDGWTDTVRAFFHQTLDLVPDIHAHIDAQETAFVRRVGGLADLLSRLEMEPLRLRIRGTPGCGKSLIAREAPDRAVDSGRRPLLVCFNRNLAERLRARVRGGGYVDPWNGFCAKFLESQGAKLDFRAASTNPRFWQEVQEQVIGAVIPDDWLSGQADLDLFGRVAHPADARAQVVAVVGRIRERIERVAADLSDLAKLVAFHVSGPGCGEREMRDRLACALGPGVRATLTMVPLPRLASPRPDF